MKNVKYRKFGKRMVAALLCLVMLVVTAGAAAEPVLAAEPVFDAEPVYAADPMFAAKSTEITTFVTHNNKEDAVSLSIKDGALCVDSLPSTGSWQEVSLGIRKGEAKEEYKTFPVSALGTYPLPTEDCTCYVYLALRRKGTSQTILNGTELGITIKNGKASFVNSPVYDNNKKLFSKRSTSDVILGYYKTPDSDVIDGDPKEIKALAKKIVSAGDSDYEKIKKVHDWVATNIWYDYDAYLGVQMEGDVSYVTPIKVLETKRTICEGYANLTAELLRSLGIPARVVGGRISYGTWKLENTGPHAWNEVYVDGRWIILDTTWDSGNRYYKGEFSEQKPSKRTYFDPTLEYFSKDHKLEQYDDENAKWLQEYRFKKNAFSVSSTFMVLTKKGETRQLKVTKAKGYEYIKMKNVKITYSSSDKKVATVNSKGKITAKKRGTAIITTKIKFDSFTIKYETQVDVWGNVG